jgi:hypothetical protein
MSLETVRTDYVKERVVLQAWKTRMGLTEEVTEVPPESQMSDEYKEGWITYLNFVLKISKRMIDMCDDALANNGNTNLLVQKLNQEADAYENLADQARKHGLSELGDMLEHECAARRLLVTEL